MTSSPLELLQENNCNTYNEFAVRINKPKETVRSNLRALERLDLLSRNGADKNDLWIV